MMEKLFDDYTYDIVNNETFSKFFAKNRRIVFKNHFSFDFLEFLNEKQIEVNKKHFAKERFQLNILIYKKEKLVGWHFGFEDGVNFYMCNTGIFEGFQNQGIYTALLPEIIKLIKLKGYHKITSKHIISNNAVIIPKLKAGFVITGMHVHEKFGTMLDLSYYYNNTMKKAYLMRTGEKKLANL